jgi:hypothetical protein
MLAGKSHFSSAERVPLAVAGAKCDADQHRRYGGRCQNGPVPPDKFPKAVCGVVGTRGHRLEIQVLL